MAKYKVIVDREACVSCGVAQALCPDVFVLAEDNNKNKVVDKYEVEGDEKISVGIIPEELYECAKSAADSCPPQAIRIEKIEG